MWVGRKKAADKRERTSMDLAIIAAKQVLQLLLMILPLYALALTAVL